MGNVVAQSLGGATLFNSANPNSPMGPSATTPVGGSQPHNNFQPYLCVDFIISLFGIFPSQT
jgi:microcystin-dependent protein